MPYTLSAAVLLTAGSALIRNDAVIGALVCWGLLLPVLLSAVLDRIEFEDGVIQRRGPLAFLIARMSRSRQQLAISDIESISTETTSLSFANGDARLIYRTHIHGAGVEIVVRSHRSAYVRFIKALFAAAGPHKLDPRSFEIFEYLENHDTLDGTRVLRTEIAAMPFPLLRRLANSLRLAGRLAQASSYFRIAYEKEPRNPELLYEMSRFFHSTAQAEDARLLQRSDACLRLASRLAGEAPDLLERLGEAFFERLDYKRATDCFRRALAFDPARIPRKHRARRNSFARRQSLLTSLIFTARRRKATMRHSRDSLVARPTTMSGLFAMMIFSRRSSGESVPPIRSVGREGLRHCRSAGRGSLLELSADLLHRSKSLVGL
jgi:tetratricopeptide (TPR) repeat protein